MERWHEILLFACYIGFCYSPIKYIYIFTCAEDNSKGNEIRKAINDFCKQIFDIFNLTCNNNNFLFKYIFIFCQYIGR